MRGRYYRPLVRHRCAFGADLGRHQALGPRTIAHHDELTGSEFADALGLMSDWFAFTTSAGSAESTGSAGSDTGYWVVTADGVRHEVGTFVASEGYGAWAAPLHVNPADVKKAEVVSPSGAVIATATLG